MILAELQPSYFTKPDHYELVRKIMVPEFFFEYKSALAFVMDKEKDVVFQEPLDNFKKNSLPYLSNRNPHFPAVPLSPNTVISRKTATNTVPLSGRTIPDRPVGKSPAVAEPFSWRKPNSMILRKGSIRF